MARFAVRLLIACMALGGTAAVAQQGAPVVRTAAGSLRGVREGPVVTFKGIPYAAPPVGPLRWRAPQPLVRWAGIRPADKVGAICEQTYQPTDNGVGPLPMSEDCLTLNVFAPDHARKAPVMFWIHGGGFVNGSGTAALYDGAALARQGVVVVTINYRLGRFGFFAHPALTAASRGEPVGNYGLMDIIAALQWTRRNIAAFGGDASNVTIFGESAGGVAVNDLMVSPAARRLFAKAIVESGLGREQTLPLSRAEAAGTAFAASLGLGSASADDLRRLDAAAILKAGDPDLFGGGGPMLDGKILTTSPPEGFKARREADVPYIVGWNKLEFPVPAAFLTAKVGSGSPLTSTLLDSARQAYPDAASFEENLLSDVIFVEPAVNLARLHAAAGRPTFVYQFSILPKSAPATLKATPHAFDRQYVFETLNASPFPTDSNDAAQAATVSAYWTRFAATGNPNGGSRPAWPIFVPGEEAVLDFTNDGPQRAPLPRRKAIDILATAYSGR